MRSFQLGIKMRLISIFYGCALLFLFLILRLVDIQAVEKDRFKYLALQQHLRKMEITGLRGSIYDRSGELLAKSLELPSLAADTTKIQDTQYAAKKISRILGLKYSDLLKDLNNKTTFVWLKRKVSQAEADEVLKLKINGVFLIKESSGRRFYPKGKLASHILGSTGVDDQGLDGIECIYENNLKGKKGLFEAEIDNIGRAIPTGKFKVNPAEKGSDIYLTIDETIQYHAERELSKCVKEYAAKSGSVIVVKVNTGEILAMANYPDYRNEDYFKASSEQLRNRAIIDSYEPGSTFKVILGSAALDSGKVKPEDKFYCGQSINIGPWQIRNANDGLSSDSGQENLREIITYSFNVGTASVALKIGSKILQKYVNDFGFGSLTNIDLPGETTGILPSDTEWADVTTATVSFGQGISVTPLQLVMAMSAIANGGTLYKPHVIRYIKDKDGNIIKEYKPEKVRQVISFQTAVEMAGTLRQVVEKGTGKKAQIAGYQTAGKTGTAQVCENGGYASSKYIASFVGFAPVEKPEIAVLVKIDEPTSAIWGGVVAAPVFSNVARQTLWHLGILPTNPEETQTAGINKFNNKKN